MNNSLPDEQSIPIKQKQDSIAKVNLPYFDLLLGLIKDGDDDVAQSFGRHVHWGYWYQPGLAAMTASDFADAAENLTGQLCLAGRIKNGLQVLDAGCGFGGTVAHINEHYTGMELVGLNLDERQLFRAQATVKPLADNRIQFLQGNACALPFQDHSFDAVLAVECIFHFPDRKMFFEEAYRVLRPGGFLALSDFIPGAALLPLVMMKMSLPERLSTGFYGKCNVQCTSKHYRKLAAQTQFKLRVELDITDHTLPTYAYIRNLARKCRVSNKTAMIETAAIEWASRLRLMKYYIYAFQKPKQATVDRTPEMN